MAFKKMVERLTKSVDELDRQDLTQFCDARHFEAMDHLVPRHPVHVGGEVRAVRIVPRAGAAALEVTVSDGRGQVVAVFLGRRRIAGLSPGRKIAVSGVVVRDGSRWLLFNPAYEILS
jgi:RecG-like helicase